jgi:unsaturated rhamnogalacturonyl hydrolase
MSENIQTNDSNTPLHLIDPDYDMPYGIPSKEEITIHLERILAYLEKATPAILVNKTNNLKINKSSEIDELAKNKVKKL